MDDDDEDIGALHKNIKSNFGRKFGEPKLSGDDFVLWSKYYHSTYGQPLSNPYYRDTYAADAVDLGKNQKQTLGKMRELKDVLNRERTKLLDYTALLEDQHDTLYRMNRDPYYEYLLTKHPNYRDSVSYFPRRREVNERLSKLDSFYNEKLRWAEENARRQRNRDWLNSYLKKREKDREKPKQTLKHLESYLDQTGEANRRIAEDYDHLKHHHKELDEILAKQKASIKLLESKLMSTNAETNRRAANMRAKFEQEAEMLSNSIAQEKMLRHSLIPRLSLDDRIPPRHALAMNGPSPNYDFY